MNFIRRTEFELIKKSDVIIFLAHPDDEIFFPIILDFLNKNYSVQLIYTCSGNLGHNRTNYNLDEKALIVHREQELYDALIKLRINRSPIKLDFSDLSLYKKDVCFDIEDLFQNIISKVTPKFLFSFGPDGITSHPDHIKVGQFAFNAAIYFNSTILNKNNKIKCYQVALSKKNFIKFKKNMINCQSDSWLFLSYVPNSLINLKISTDKFASKLFDSASYHFSQWTKQELRGFYEFYKSNSSEYTSIKSFPNVKELKNYWAL